MKQDLLHTKKGEGISIDADSGPLRHVLWCCGGICHQLLTFIQICCGHTVATGFETGDCTYTLTYPWISSSFLYRFVDDFTIEELCMTGYESLDGPEFVKPILPPMEDHPGLKVAKSQKLFSFSYQCRISFFDFSIWLKSRQDNDFVPCFEDGTKWKCPLRFSHL